MSVAVIDEISPKIGSIAERHRHRDEAVGLVLHLELEVKDQAVEVAADDIRQRGVEQLLKARPKSYPPGFTETGRRQSDQERVDERVEEVRLPVDEPIDDILNSRVVQEAIRPSCSKTPAALAAKPISEQTKEIFGTSSGPLPSALPPAGGRRQQTT